MGEGGRLGRTPSGVLDDLVSELKVLARLKSISDYRRGEFPAIRRALLVSADAVPSSADDDPIRTGLDHALSIVPDEQYRDAAMAIFGFHDNRWSSLRARQSDAARAFGVGFEAFRRHRGGDRPSLYDECLGEMARAVQMVGRMGLSSNGGPAPAAGTTVQPPTATPDRPMVEATPEREPAGEPTDADTRAPDERRRPLHRVVRLARHSPVALVALVAGGAGAGAGMVIDEAAIGASDRMTTAGSIDVDSYCKEVYGLDSHGFILGTDAVSWRCAVPGREAQPVDFGQACKLQHGFETTAVLIDYEDPLTWGCAVPEDRAAVPLSRCVSDAGGYLSSSIEELSPYSRPFREAFDRLESDEPICVLTPMYSHGLGVVQDIGHEGRITGRIFATDPQQPAVVLTGSAWATYHRFGGGVGLSASLMGYPLNEPQQERGVWQISGSNGGALMSAEREGPYFLVSQLSLAAWQENGAGTGPLGAPISDLYGVPQGVRQDFEGGFVALTTSGVTVEPTAEG